MSRNGFFPFFEREVHLNIYTKYGTLTKIRCRKYIDKNLES